MKSKIFMSLAIVLLPLLTFAQSKNTATEVRDYRETDGKIIIEMVVNGERADFVLDLSGHNAILPEYAEKFHIDTASKGDFRYDTFLYKKVPTAGSVSIGTMAFGNNVFGNNVSAFVLEEQPYLRKLGVAGIIGGALFQNVVLTIDSKRKKITTSVPYRPSYMKLDHRADMNTLPGSVAIFPVTLDSTALSLVFDTWNNGMFTLTPADYTKINGTTGSSTELFNGYAEAVTTNDTKLAGKCTFVKNDLSDVLVSENKDLPCSVLGTGILNEGIISIDFQKQKVYFQSFDLAEVKDEVQSGVEVTVEAGKLNPITRDYFLEHGYDYRAGKEFVFKGDKPVVIDFWATWCGPCMRLIPELEKMAEKYKDKVIFLKVNADQEKELCSIFNVVALPTLFFIPVGGKPIIETGALPEKYEKIIQEQLLK